MKKTVKRYNLSKIMKNAWSYVKTAGLCISEGLKRAWKEAKSMKEKFEKCVKIAKRKNGKIYNENVGTERDSEANYFTFKLWERGDKKRVYVNDYKRRAVGYIDCKNNNCIVSDYSAGNENYDTIKWFLENYEIV